MSQSNEPKKKTKKTEKGVKIKLHFMPDSEESAGEDNEEELEAWMMLEKEDVKLIYNALAAYKPTGEEKHLHGVLLEEFEEILIVDYNEELLGVN
jgi:hypothetical protein